MASTDAFGTLAVIGLGYVGLPLAVALAQNCEVIGFDKDEQRVRELSEGFDRTGEVVQQTLKTAKLSYTCSTGDLVAASIYMISVPTPVDAAKQPEMKYLRSACQIVGKALKPGNIVVFESTVYPGVTEDVCGPELEAASGLKCGVDFYLGYSPERINPGDRTHTIDRIIKVVAGQTQEVEEKLARLYQLVSPAGIYVAKDIKTAEAAKVIENAQRDINIAFINEVTQIFTKMGLSVHDVLDAANTKWNFLPFTPGLVGGHCIGVDPFYLAHGSRMVGHEPEIILAGRRINDGMAQFVADWLVREINRAKLEMDPNANFDRKVLVLGITFKEDVPDLRNTGSVQVVRRLQELGFDVDLHDPMADPATAYEEYSLKLLQELPSEPIYAAVIGLVGHKAYRSLQQVDLSCLLQPGGIVADPKSIWKDWVSTKSERVIRL